MRLITFHGLSGSGKTHVAKAYSTWASVPVIEASDVWLEYCKVNNHPRTQMLPNEVFYEQIMNAIPSGESTVLLVGFPRDCSSQSYLDSWLQQGNELREHIAILVDAPLFIARQRAMQRSRADIEHWFSRLKFFVDKEFELILKLDHSGVLRRVESSISNNELSALLGRINQ
mgnify:CR=1 FL=1